MSKNVVWFLTLVFLISGCRSEDTLSPNSFRGTYVLDQANAKPLPLLLSDSPPWRYTLLAETLTFEGEGRVTRARTIREENSATGVIKITPMSFNQGFRIDHSSVEIGSFTPCAPNALCIANDTGVVLGETIALLSNQYNRAELTYKRAGQ